MKKIRVAFLTCFTAIMLVIALPFSTYASPTGSTWTVNVAAPYNISTNSKYSDSAVWDFSSFWATAAADAMPANYYAKNYPEIKTVQVFGATGGCYTGFAQICGPARDPFINPANTATMTDYDFSVIIHGLRNIVRQGLKPYLKTGNVPVKYSTGATIGAFGLNVRPPDDYNVYYNYIKAMATAFVNEFGLSEVRSWRWSVLSEYENSDWFLAADGTAASTKVAYFKLYDYTAKALEDVLGAGQVNIGAHAQGNLGALWDYRELFDHVTSGTNYATGGTGAPIKFASLSFYDLKPGTLGNFTSALSTLRSKLDAVGLNGLPVGIDEGWMLQGADGKELHPGSVSWNYQSALDALRYQQMIDYNVSWAARWYLNTDGLYASANPINSTQTNLAKLVAKMDGGKLLPAAQGGLPVDGGDHVGSYSAYNQTTSKLFIMIFNRSNNTAATTSEPVTITVNNVDTVNSCICSRKWQIDDQHANFWPTWKADRVSQGITSSAYLPQMTTDTWLIPTDMTNATSIAYWNSRKSVYSALSKLTPASASADVTVGAGSLTVTTTVPAQGVVLYEICGVEVAQ